MSVYLYSITGLHHVGLRKARNVICLFSPQLCCLFGGKAIHMLHSLWEHIETVMPSKETPYNQFSVHINLHITCKSTLYIQHVSLQANKPLQWEWNEAECIPACEGLCLVALYAATLMEKYVDGLTERTEIWIHIPHKFPWALGKKIESRWEPSYVIVETDSS